MHHHYTFAGESCPMNPSGNLTLHDAGSGPMLYATTQHGGTNGVLLTSGTLFTIDPDLSADSCKVLHSFGRGTTDAPNGYYARHGSLVSNGTYLYGVTTEGGAEGCGLFYRFDVPGSGFDPLISFTGTETNPSNPHCDPILVDSTFYGLSQLGGETVPKVPKTSGGGTEQLGTLYSIDQSDLTSVNVLHPFDGSGGARPHSAPTYVGQGADACLIGMTRVGGSGWDPKSTHKSAVGLGVIFRYDFSGAGTFSVIHKFSGGKKDGATPYHNNLLLVDGTLYGMTHSGGHADEGGEPDTGHGVVFSIQPDGSGFEILHAFRGKNHGGDGSKPLGSLIQDPRPSHSKTLYGTTAHGGDNNFGTLFSIETDKSDYTVLHRFTGLDGSMPADSPLWYDNKLYGLTAYSGTTARQGNGVVFAHDVT